MWQPDTTEEDMADIIHRVGIKAPLAHVYEALATVEGVARWWTDETSGSSKTGGSVEVVFRAHGDEKGRMEFEVLELRPNERVHWRCKSGPPEWVGTDVTFQLTRERRLHDRPIRSSRLARASRVHGPLQHQVGRLHAQPARPGRDRYGQAVAARSQDRQLELALGSAQARTSARPSLGVRGHFIFSVSPPLSAGTARVGRQKRGRRCTR